MNTDLQNKFIELASQYENIKKEMKEKKEQLQGLMREIGVGSMFQDPNSKLVYKIVVPSGTFITFDTIGYDRTKKEEERQGSLSKKEAEEAGFILK